jgi:cobalt-zinc-cadmium efflux system membrane fusion protein
MSTAAALLALTVLVAAPAAAQDAGHDHDHDHAHDHAAEHQDAPDADHAAEPGHAPAAGPDAGEGVVRLSAAVQREFGIATAPAGPAEILQTVTAPAEVRPHGDRLAHITPRYPGVITAVSAHLGDRVTAGQSLAEVEADATLAPYALRTLIDGVVVEKHAVLGEAVGRGDRAFVVADLGEVWIDLAVHQHDFAALATGQPVHLHHCHDHAGPAGVISYVAPTVDPHTRTGTARLVVPNPDGHWRPGTFLSAEVVTGRQAVPVAVPRDAVQTVHGHPAVFVATAAGFAVREVTLGVGDRAHVAVTAGLRAGEPVVTAGAFVLKSELEKAGFGHGHSH